VSRLCNQSFEHPAQAILALEREESPRIVGVRRERQAANQQLAENLPGLRHLAAQQLAPLLQPVP